MLRERAFWYATGASLLLLFIFSHPLIWIPLVALIIGGAIIQTKEKRTREDWHDVGDKPWEQKSGVRYRWLNNGADAQDDQENSSGLKSEGDASQSQTVHEPPDSPDRSTRLSDT